jgi:hypothetical protein
MRKCRPRSGLGLFGIWCAIFGVYRAPRVCFLVLEIVSNHRGGSIFVMMNKAGFRV